LALARVARRLGGHIAVSSPVLILTHSGIDFDSLIVELVVGCQAKTPGFAELTGGPGTMLA
jgi:hypothetical protein